MPFRSAHWFILLLFPLSLFAFWPGYFGVLGSASFALHAHGVTALLWLGLVALQSWSGSTRKLVLHRASGRAVFVVVPLFAAGGLLVMHSMATKFANGHPFYLLFGPRLGMVDAMAAIAVPAFVAAALVHRRQVALHAGYMLATLLLLLSPIFGRLFGFLMMLMPGFPWGITDRHPFELAFHAAQLVTLGISLGLWRRYPRAAAPFLAAALLIVVQSLAFATIAATPAWDGMFAALSRAPAGMLATLGIVYAAAALWFGWRQKPGRTPVAALT